MPVVRISRGSFKPDDYGTIAKLLDESQRTLVPDIRRLEGCLHYWAAIDQRSNTMVNVSVWQSVSDAKQMDTFAPMVLLAGEFIKLGIVFERPIVNYEILWEI